MALVARRGLTRCDPEVHRVVLPEAIEVVRGPEEVGCGVGFIVWIVQVLSGFRCLLGSREGR